MSEYVVPCQVFLETVQRAELWCAFLALQASVSSLASTMKKSSIPFWCCWMVVRESCFLSSFRTETLLASFRKSCTEGLTGVSRSVKLKVMLPRLWLATHCGTGGDVNRWPYSANQEGNELDGVERALFLEILIKHEIWCERDFCCPPQNCLISVSTTPGRTCLLLSMLFRCFGRGGLGRFVPCPVEKKVTPASGPLWAGRILARLREGVMCWSRPDRFAFFAWVSKGVVVLLCVMTLLLRRCSNPCCKETAVSASPLVGHVAVFVTSGLGDVGVVDV